MQSPEKASSAVFVEIPLSTGNSKPALPSPQDVDESASTGQNGPNDNLMVVSAIEYCCFCLPGMMAPAMAAVYFSPSKSSLGDEQPANLHFVPIFAIFAAGFLLRPLGTLLLGELADLVGVRRAVQVSLGLLATSTFLIGCLPTWESIGIAAPIILVILRLIQGLTLGGDTVSCAVFDSDHAPRGQSSYRSALPLSGASLGLFFSATLSSFLYLAFVGSGWFPVTAMPFRVLFWLGGLVAAVLVFLRAGDFRLVSSLRQEQRQPHHKRPELEAMVEVGSKYKLEVLVGAAVFTVYQAAVYLVFVWVPTYLWAISPNPITSQAVFPSSAIALLLNVLLMPQLAKLGDVIGARKLMMISCVLLAAAGPLVFTYLLSSGSIGLCYLGSIILSILMSAYGGPMFGLLIKATQSSSRYTVTGLSYDMAAVVGGLMPLFATLVSQKEVTFGPGLLITLTAVLSFLGLLVEPVIFPGGRHHHHHHRPTKVDSDEPSECEGDCQSMEEDCKEDHDAAKDNLF